MEFLGIGLFFFICFLLWGYLQDKKFQKQLLAQDAQEKQVNQIQNQIQGMSQQIQQVLHQSQSLMGQRLDHTLQLMNQMQNQLGQLDQGTKRVIEIGKDISALQDILRAPKLRGSLGELFLGDLLAQLLPQTHYELQYSFQSKEKVDAVIKLFQGLVPVDSKFPLESFRRMLSASSADEKKMYKKAFAKDCRVHIDSIASKYIKPEEGTFDFALMYIPAENVYYETMIRDEDGQEDLWQFALEKRVIPVSPNSFVAYLQSVVMGLKGLRMEKNVKEVLAVLSGMQNEFQKLQTDFELVGTHLQRAQNAYQQTEKRWIPFQSKMQSLTSIEDTPKILEKE